MIFFSKFDWLIEKFKNKIIFYVNILSKSIYRNVHLRAHGSSVATSCDISVRREAVSFAGDGKSVSYLTPPPTRCHFAVMLSRHFHHMLSTRHCTALIFHRAEEEHLSSDWDYVGYMENVRTTFCPTQSPSVTPYLGGLWEWVCVCVYLKVWVESFKF